MNPYLSLIEKIPVTEHSKVLDIGAGGFGGQNTVANIIKKFNPEKITLIENNQGFMDKLSGYTTCTKILADFFEYDFGDERFDLISIDLDSLVQFGMWKKIWTKVYKLLNENGYVIFYGITNMQFIYTLNARQSRENENLIKEHLKATYGTDTIVTRQHYIDYFLRTGFEFIDSAERSNLLSWFLVKKSGERVEQVKAQPILSVAIPAFNSGNIAWLAMEGLCNQKGIDFDWEILIAEETAKPEYNSFGIDNFRSYQSRLKKVGCKNIKYLLIEKRISLTEKWKILGEMADVNSIGFVLQACDCYSYPTRLKTTYQAMLDGYDWFNHPLGYFYEISTEKIIKYDGNTIAWSKNHLNMAFRTYYAKRIPFAELPMGIDGWLLRTFETIKCEPLKIFNDDSPDWQNGVDTHGANNISKKRGEFFVNTKPPFVSAEGVTIDQILPKKVVQKLKEIK